jgi:hypothetical protein
MQHDAKHIFFWEEAKVKKYIDALVIMGNMKPSSSEYACRVILPIKNDGIH